MARIKILYYGINGTGLGHLSRLLRIAREARALANTMGIQTDFRFITTSEASNMVWDFPVYKIPSKTVVAVSDTPNHEYIGNSQFFITNLVASIRPDILVMDTMPEGSFGEFLSLKSFCRKTVFINRHKKEDVANNELHRQFLPIYDLILTPDYHQNSFRYHLPETVRGTDIYTDPIHGYREENTFSKEDVRKKFCVKENQKLVYVSAGGGGDKKAQNDLELIIDTLLVKKHKLLVGYGPLYKGKIRYEENIIPFCEAEVNRYFKGIDFAISAAGYNTFQELLAAKVPTAFFAQVKGMDLQEERILEGEKKGLNLYIDELGEITQKINFLESPEVILKIKSALDNRKVTHGASNAAIELLKLHNTIPGSPVNYEVLPFISTIRRCWSNYSIQVSIHPELSLQEYRNVSCMVYLLYSVLPNREKQLIFERLFDAEELEKVSLINQWLQIGTKLSDWQKNVDWTTGKLKAILKQFIHSNPLIKMVVSLDKLITYLNAEKILLEKRN